MRVASEEIVICLGIVISGPGVGTKDVLLPLVSCRMLQVTIQVGMLDRVLIS